MTYIKNLNNHVCASNASNLYPPVSLVCVYGWWLDNNIEISGHIVAHSNNS